jgi:hypothetical protein
VGIAHFDDAPTREYELCHLGGRWTFVGEAAGSVQVGVAVIGRIEQLDYWAGED